MDENNIIKSSYMLKVFFFNYEDSTAYNWLISINKSIKTCKVSSPFSTEFSIYVRVMNELHVYKKGHKLFTIWINLLLVLLSILQSWRGYIFFNVKIY